MRLASRLARTPEITEVLHDEAFQPCALNAMCLSETPYEALERFRRRCTLANRLQGCEHRGSDRAQRFPATQRLDGLLAESHTPKGFESARRGRAVRDAQDHEVTPRARGALSVRPDTRAFASSTCNALESASSLNPRQLPRQAPREQAAAPRVVPGPSSVSRMLSTAK